MTTFDSSITCSYLYVITQYGYPPPAGDTHRYLEEMKMLGFASVELEGIREDNVLAMHEQRHEIYASLQTLGLEVPYYCIVLPELGSAVAQARDHNLQVFEKGCETARALGACGVLDNAPLPPYQFPSNIPIVRHYDEKVLMAAQLPADLHWPSYWKDLVDTYRAACDIAHGYGLTYHMHPCLGVLSATTDAYLYFADAVQRDNLRFNLDTANQFMMKDNLTLSLLRLADRIDYIHLSDTGGVNVEHLPPGDGVIQWGAFFETLRRIHFSGHIGLDIGGGAFDGADIADLYREAAQWVQQRWTPQDTSR